MLYRLREAIVRFMYGRYGGDELNKFLLVVLMVVVVVNVFTNNLIVMIAELVIAVIILVRMLSRNHEKRRAENAVYLRAKARVLGLFRRGQGHEGRSNPTFRDRMQYKYMSCPSCSQKVRVPRGKGTVEVRCPRCGTIFRERT